MTQAELINSSGVRAIRTISPTTTVIEFTHGGVRPASELELTMWGILTRLTGDVRTG